VERTIPHNGRLVPSALAVDRPVFTAAVGAGPGLYRIDWTQDREDAEKRCSRLRGLVVTAEILAADARGNRAFSVSKNIRIEPNTRDASPRAHSVFQRLMTLSSRACVLASEPA